MIPMIVLHIIYVLSALMVCIVHGEPNRGKFNGFFALADSAFMLLLIWWSHGWRWPS